MARDFFEERYKHAYNCISVVKDVEDSLTRYKRSFEVTVGPDGFKKFKCSQKTGVSEIEKREGGRGRDVIRRDEGRVGPSS